MAGLAAGVLSVTAAPAYAATYEVDSEAELREAVAAANASPGADVIELTGSVTFATPPTGEADGPEAGDLDLTDDLRLVGNDETIDAARTDRVFDVPTGVSLALEGVVLRNGLPTQGASGGAVRSAGTLEVVDTLFVDNSALGTGASGGAVLNDGGSLTVAFSRFRANTADRAGGAVEAVGGTTRVESSRMTGNTTGTMPGNGGAVHLTGTGSVAVVDTTVIGNVAGSEGGGLWNSSTGTMRVVDSYLTENTARGAAADNGGGALFNDGGLLVVRSSGLEDNEATGAAGSGGALLNLGEARVRTSDLFDNRARRAGGAIEAVGGTTTLTAVQLLGNTTGGAPGNGGGLHLTGAGDVSVVDSLVAQNRAANEGGGLWNSADGTMQVSGTTVADNVANGDAADSGGGGLYNDGGDLTVEAGTAVLRNRALGTSGSGGGVLDNQGTLTLTGSRVVGNSATRAGGGIETNAGQVQLRDLRLLRNTTGANPGNGGGLHLTGAAVVDYTGGLVQENVAASQGGGLWNSSTGVLTVRDVTVRRNEAPRRPNFYNDGGAFTVDGRPVPVG